MSKEQRIRCPQCGALSAPNAEWCGQCYAKLGRSTHPSMRAAGQNPAHGPGPAPVGGVPTTPAQPAAGHPSVPPPPMPVPPAEAAAAASRDDRREAAERREAPVDRRVGEDRRSPEGRPTPASLLNTLWEMPTVPEPEGLASPIPGSDLHDGDGPAQPIFLDAPARPAASWPCAVCDTPNPLERDTCMSCGEPFSRLFQEHEARPEVDPAKAARWSMVFPGLGHAVAGRKAEGVARGVLFAWCALTAILLLTAHAAGGLGILGPLAIVFVLGSAAWYAVTALDAYRLANGDRQVVTPKIMLYSVAGLMMLSVASVFIMVTRASHIAH